MEKIIIIVELLTREVNCRINRTFKHKTYVTEILFTQSNSGHLPTTFKYLLDYLLWNIENNDTLLSFISELLSSCNQHF